MKVLDLFCGGGGAGVGLHRAGFKVSGIDIVRSECYPFAMRQDDVLDLSVNSIRAYDFVWASPPCQKYSRLTKRYQNCKNNKNKVYPDLVDKTRELLIAAGKPFVIENVFGSPLRRDLILCGTMFGLCVFRHRIFEIYGFTVTQPPHPKHNGRTGTHRYPWRPQGGFVQVTGHMFKLSEGQRAMGIDWIKDRHTLAQAIPPAYSQYIGEQFLKANKEVV